MAGIVEHAVAAGILGAVRIVVAVDEVLLELLEDAFRSRRVFAIVAGVDVREPRTRIGEFDSVARRA